MYQQKVQPVCGKRAPLWRLAIDSVFAAAQRLHQYRDARDVLLQYVIDDQECHPQQLPCVERCR